VTSPSEPGKGRAAKDAKTILPAVASWRLLPLEQLHDVDFEGLCSELVAAQPGVVRADLKRTRGAKQFGADVEGMGRDQRPFLVLQAKRWKTIDATCFKKWGDAFLDHWDGHWRDAGVMRFILAVTVELNNDALNRAIAAETARFDAVGVKYEVWGLAQLTSKARELPRTISHYLHPVWADAINVAPADPFRAYLKALIKDIDHRLLGGQLIDLRVSERLGAIERAAPPPPSALPSRFYVRPAGPANFGDLRSAARFFNDRLLLLGAPGSGKTVSMLLCARQAAAERLDDMTAPIPVILPVATWRSEYRPDALLAWLAESSPRLGEMLEDVEDALCQGDVLLLLDGLDELAPSAPGGSSANAQMEFLRHIPPDAKVVISCRSHDYERMGLHLDLGGAVELRELTEAQVNAALSVLPSATTLAAEKLGLKALATTPLMLGLLTLFLDGPDFRAAPFRGGLSVEELRDRLFDSLIDQRFMREGWEGSPDMLHQLHDVLGRVAMLDAGGGGNQNIFTRADVVTVAGSTKAADTVLAVAERLHLVVQEGYRLRFAHLSLRDHLALKCAVEVLSDVGETAEMRDRAAWAVWQIPDPRALPALLLATHDPEPYVRGSAAGALGAIGDEKALHRLREMQKDLTEVTSLYGSTISEVADWAIRRIAASRA
jgi:hypothetical protein